MQVLIRREQATGLMGKSKYSLRVRAEIDADEQELIRKNNLGGELLVYQAKGASPESVVGGAIKYFLTDTKLTVNSFAKGTTFACDNVAELLAIERDVKQAAVNLATYLEASRHFGGELSYSIDDLRKELVA